MHLAVRYITKPSKEVLIIRKAMAIAKYIVLRELTRGMSLTTDGCSRNLMPVMLA